jgi:hypothetical protein
VRDEVQEKTRIRKRREKRNSGDEELAEKNGRPKTAQVH